MLSLRELEIIDAVLESGGMSAAARRLRVSQPAVSRAVAAVEQRLKAQLFVRTPAALTPTAELLALRPVLRRIFEDIAAVQRNAELMKFGAGRVLRFAATPALASAFSAQAIALLRARYPALRLHAKVREPGPIKLAVARREFDVGMVYNETWATPLSTRDLAAAPVVCVVPVGHPFADAAEVTPAMLRAETLISFSSTSVIGADLDRLFAEAGESRDVAVQIGNSFMAAPLVAARVGVALVDPFIVGSPMAAGLVARPFAPERPLTPRVVWGRDHPLSPPEACFVEALASVAARWAATHGEGLRATSRPDDARSAAGETPPSPPQASLRA